jgi:hypothetical protein
MTIKSARGAVIGVFCVVATASLWDQTLGTVGMFESLSYSTRSLIGVEWWGLPIFEFTIGLVMIVCLIELIVRAVRREFDAVSPTLHCFAHQVGFFGVWILLFSTIANFDSGNGLPQLFSVNLERSWPGRLVLFVVVDAVYYVEQRSRLWLQLRASLLSGSGDRDPRTSPSSPRPSSAEGMRSGVADPLWSAVFLVPLGLLGFDFLWVVAFRLIITLYKILINLRWLPGLAWLEVLFATPASQRARQSVRPIDRSSNFGGIFRLWDHLFNTAAVVENRRVKVVRSKP